MIKVSVDLSARNWEKYLKEEDIEENYRKKRTGDISSQYFCSSISLATQLSICPYRKLLGKSNLIDMF
jgi:hypothetical protein